MDAGPAFPGPGRDEDPARYGAGPDDPLWDGTGDWRPAPPGTDWMDDPDLREAYLAALADEDEPDDPDLYPDPDNAPPPGLDDRQLAALIAEARELTAEQAGAVAWLDRRGPGMPGSGRRLPGECAGPAAGFGAGRELDTAPGCGVLMQFAENAAGDGDRYDGASDDELLGLICAWDRIEATAAARKHAAVAELIRRRPAEDCAAVGPGRMPTAWEEFTAAELAPALGESRGGAESLLDLAHELAARLPGTAAAFRSGIVSRYKAEIIARAIGALDPAEAAAAETLVLDRAGRLTPGGLRAAIGRAVMEVAPDKARKRREQAARLARVERWAEHSGNAALAGRELPPAQVFAADQRVTWWARQLKRAGLAGDMDQLRARAYLDILLGIDSRPGLDGAGAGPPGFAGKVNLTIPLATLLGLADRPGEIGGIGPIDPDLARDLARAAAIAECDHRHQARGHDPGVMLRHLTQIRHATCTAPTCRRPAVQCDFEHSTPYEAGGRTCECNGGPKCRRDHRLKQDPRWKAEQPSPGIIVWTTPAGRHYTTEPTSYPV